MDQQLELVFEDYKFCWTWTYPIELEKKGKWICCRYLRCWRAADDLPAHMYRISPCETFGGLMKDCEYDVMSDRVQFQKPKDA